MARLLRGAHRLRTRHVLLRPSCKPEHDLPSLPACSRGLNSSRNLQEYPKEGVFQKNSPKSPLTRIAQSGHASHIARGAQPQPQAPTPTEHEQSSVFHNPPYAVSPPPSQRSRTWRYVRIGMFSVYMTLVAVTGFIIILELGTELLPLPFEPGSEEDLEALALLAEDLDTLPLVQDLRSTYTRDNLTGALTPQWREWTAYKALKDPTSPVASLQRRESTLSTGPLKGSRGFAAQTVFWSETLKTAIVIINFGEAVCGWPGNVHGGAIATFFDECLARVAGRCLDAKALVTACMDVDYLAPCRPGEWYAVAVTSLPDEPDPSIASLPDQKFASQHRVLEAVRQQVRDNALRAEDRARAISEGRSAEDVDKPRRKVWVHGKIICLDETGPSLEEVIGHDVGDGVAEPHTHALGAALFVAPKESSFSSGELHVGATEF